MLIAVCDKNRADAEKIRFSLMDVSRELESVYFETGDKLIESVRNGNFYSIVFQNFHLENESDMETVRAIKAFSPGTQIVFVINGLDRDLDTLKTQAVDYLVKPYTETDIVKAFTRVNLRLNNRDSMPVVLNVGKKIHVFHPKNVIKLESNRHYTIVHQEGKSERVRISFADAAMLFGKMFIEIRRGMLVNLGCIERISGSNVILTDGSSYVLPKGKKDKVIQLYAQYVFEKNGKRPWHPVYDEGNLGGSLETAE